MADIIDMAQEQEEKLREMVLRQRETVEDGYEADTDTPRYCDDCDEQIPLERVKAVPYCTRCIDCQEYAERGV